MEDPTIVISLLLFIINAVALALAFHFDRFKITVVILAIFDVLTIIILYKKI